MFIPTRIENLLLYFSNSKLDISYLSEKQLNSSDNKTIHLAFHGSSADNYNSITQQGFKISHCDDDFYFSLYAHISLRYSQRYNCNSLILCAVIDPHVYGYEGVLITNNSNCVLPLYLVHFGQ